MWPWEHAVVGYLAYSLWCHLIYRDAPGGVDAFAAVFASVLPDLLDKPLAWEWGVFDSGYALGHSAFFALPLAVVAGALARALGRSRAGLAFAVGYLLHLPADVLYHYASGDGIRPGLVLWPVETVGAGEGGRGFLEYAAYFVGGYRETLLSGDLTTYLWIQLGLAGGTALLWLYDGAPVARQFVVGGARLVARSVARTTR